LQTNGPLIYLFPLCELLYIMLWAR